MRKQVVVVVAITVTSVAALAALTSHKRRKERQWKKTQRILRKFARDCATPVPKLWLVANKLVSEMEASLGNVSQEDSILSMLVSYTAALPNGDEKGLYYGLNLRGTNFLLLRARLGGKNEPISDLHREEIPIPSNVLVVTSQELFDHIAAELGKFISAHPPGEEDRSQSTHKKLGFTLSYPVDQAVASSGSAIKWKRFSPDDPVGKDLANDFNQTLGRHGLDMRISSMVDDTTANLAAGRYYNKDVVAAITLALGTNASYLEPRHKTSTPKQSGPSSDSPDMVISTEWGNFSCPDLPMTEFDSNLDAESSNPGRRIFEKLISAMYLGEIVRRILLKMAQETSLFGDDVPPKLAIPYLLKSPDMAAMHQDTSEDREVVAEKLNEIFGITCSTPMAREVIAEVCDIVAERGARLAGAGIVALIKKLRRMENKRSVVTVEGGLYDHYRVFRNYLHSSVWEMLGNDLSDNVILEHSRGGSGAGALFLAASQEHNSGS